MTPEPSNEYLVEAERFAALIESRIGQMFDEEAHLSGDEARRIAFTLRALPHAGDDGWQDIATFAEPTALSSGDGVLVADNDGTVGEAYFRNYGDKDDGWWWANTSWGDYPEPDRPRPTHWRPLPTPPAGISDNG